MDIYFPCTFCSMDLETIETVHSLKSVFTHVASIYANYWNKRKCLHKKKIQPPGDWYGPPTWPPFHCFGTPIWPLWRHVKTLYMITHLKIRPNWTLLSPIIIIIIIITWMVEEGTGDYSLPPPSLHLDKKSKGFLWSYNSIPMVKNVFHERGVGDQN